MDKISFDTLLVDVKNDSDRGAALIAAANLDNRLKDLLQVYFVEMTKKIKEDLFDQNRVLSSFSAKINISYASGLLSDDEFHDLNLIRKIRNEFAHKENSLKFATQTIGDWCKSFKLINALKTSHPGSLNDKETPRDLFQIAALSTTLLLTNRIEEAKKNKRIVHSKSSIL